MASRRGAGGAEILFNFNHKVHEEHEVKDLLRYLVLFVSFVVNTQTLCELCASA
jgi:hypothetical protein